MVSGEWWAAGKLDDARLLFVFSSAFFGVSPLRLREIVLGGRRLPCDAGFSSVRIRAVVVFVVCFPEWEMLWKRKREERDPKQREGEKK